MGYQPSSVALHSSVAAARLGFKPSVNDRAPSRPCDRAQILNKFDEVFGEAPAVDQRDLEEAFRLRYQVYCLDRGFEQAAACPDGLERDRYDSYSCHSLLNNIATKQALGTVRLVRPAAAPNWITRLPLAEYADIDSIEVLMRLPAGLTAEVSRFAISKSACKSLSLSRESLAPAEQESEPSWRQKLLPYMSLGLIRGLVRMSREHSVTHWCLAAEPSLLRRLRSFGLHFTDAGPLVEHRGLRQICYAELDSLLARAEAEQPECWGIMTDAGRLASFRAALSAA